MLNDELLVHSLGVVLSVGCPVAAMLFTDALRYYRLTPSLVGIQGMFVSPL